MPYEKMNLSGQAIYAPKKVFLSKSLNDGIQTPGDEERAEEPVGNQIITDDMFEIQSREFLSQFGQPNKQFYSSNSGSDQFMINNSNSHDHYLHMDFDTNQRRASNVSVSSSSFPGMFPSEISSTSPQLFSSSNSSFQDEKSFVISSKDSSSLPYGYYPKELVGQLTPFNASQVSLGTSQLTSVNIDSKFSSTVDNLQVPSVNASQSFLTNSYQAYSVTTSAIFSVSACQAPTSTSANFSVSASQAPMITSEVFSMSANQAPLTTSEVFSLSANQASSVHTNQVPPLNASQILPLDPNETSPENNRQVSQTFMVNNASSCGQNSTEDPYSTYQFLSSGNVNSIGSGQVLSGNSEIESGNKRLETLKDTKDLEQNLVNEPNNVNQSSTMNGTAMCDSTKSLVNSPESWTFSSLVPFNMSHDERKSPLSVPSETTAESMFDHVQDEDKIPGSVGSDSFVKYFGSTEESTPCSTMTWAQRYGLHAKLKKPSQQSFNRVSLADIEEFSVKSVVEKQKSVEKSTYYTSHRPPQPKKKSASPVGVNPLVENQVSCSSSPSVISSSHVSSTDMKQELSPECSYQGQNRNESYSLPSSTSEVRVVSLKILKMNTEDSSEISSTETASELVQPPGNETSCQVCGDKAAGFYCGAFICEACKKFFMRASKMEKVKYVCLRAQNCVITKESRVQCQYCRFQKCLSLKMYCPGSGDGKKKDKKIGKIPCRVCSAPSSGFHFGALTCEGCKGFFRRMAKERECQRYKCTKSGHCEVNTFTRNLCKACRYRKCLNSGMSIEGSRIGRQPNSIKHAISIEADKQGKQSRKEQKKNEEINLNDMDAVVKLATGIGPEILKDDRSEVPRNVGLEMIKDVSLEQIDSDDTNFNFTNQQVIAQENCDIEVTPILPVVTEIKQEPHSPAIRCVSPVNGPGSIIDSINSEKTLEIISKCAECNGELENLLPLNVNEGDELAGYTTAKKTWASMMASFEHTARTLIKFSKKVPGFRAISLDDQIKLIQASIYPIVVLNCSRSFDCETKQYSYFNFTPRQRQTIHSFFPMLKILSSHFIHTGIMVNLMKLSTTEYTFLSILLLLNADVESLADSDSVRELQMDTTYALQYHEETTYPDGRTRFGMLLVRLAELHFILVQHNTAITLMLKKNPDLTLPQMYKEMFGEKVLET
ncbi:uncharacterized protein LOC132546355 [Ylistrum balloti]|uniref:uncharacterized protein LOC132546355 n=1 Tax=Ylistrum balloti TaxID=509963 RepID=UPI002905CE45|nr:uncharacterized protein LOC132546355 [Ylistrum balloti]